MITLYYKKNTLDKLHEYQLEESDDEDSTWTHWIYFYMGQQLQFIPRRERLLPYSYRPTKKLGAYKNNSADKVANCIVNKIIKHRKIRGVIK